MGAKQTKEDETSTSPKSTSIAPVDHASGETSVPALLDKHVLIAIVSDSYDVSMAKAEALYNRSRLELITETAPIASRLPQWMLPTNDLDSIKKRITDALDDLKNGKSDDSKRINYTINAVEAIVDNRSKRTEKNMDEKFAALETKLAATSKELSETQQKLDKMMVLLERVAAKVKA